MKDYPEAGFIQGFCRLHRFRSGKMRRNRSRARRTLGQVKPWCFVNERADPYSSLCSCEMARPWPLRSGFALRLSSSLGFVRSLCGQRWGLTEGKKPSILGCHLAANIHSEFQPLGRTRWKDEAKDADELACCWQKHKSLLPQILNSREHD